MHAPKVRVEEDQEALSNVHLCLPNVLNGSLILNPSIIFGAIHWFHDFLRYFSFFTFFALLRFRQCFSFFHLIFNIEFVLICGTSDAQVKSATRIPPTSYQKGFLGHIGVSPLRALPCNNLEGQVKWLWVPPAALQSLFNLCRHALWSMKWVDARKRNAKLLVRLHSVA